MNHCFCQRFGRALNRAKIAAEIIQAAVRTGSIQSEAAQQARKDIKQIADDALDAGEIDLAGIILKVSTDALLGQNQ